MLIKGLRNLVISEGEICLYQMRRLKINLTGKDRWEEFDVNVVYLLKDLNEIGNNEALANRLRCMFVDHGDSYDHYWNLMIWESVSHVS